MRVLVVGLGSMGKRRIRCLQALGVESVVGCDPRDDRRAEVFARYGIRSHASVEKGLAESPDAVVFSVPPDLHLPFMTQAVRAGVPFFVETGIFLEGMTELLDEMDARGVFGAASCTMRYFPGPRRIFSLMQAGVVGKPLIWSYQCGQYLPDWHPWESISDFYVSKRETGGARELVPFELGWLLHIFGPARTVDAQVLKVSDLPVDIDDVYQLHLAHANGAVGSMIVDVLARPAVRHLRITGSEGTIEWDHTASLIRIFESSTGAWREETLRAGSPETGYTKQSPEEPYIEEMRDFLACLEGGSGRFYRFGEYMSALRLLHASEESAMLGERVYLTGEHKTRPARDLDSVG